MAFLLAKKFSLSHQFSTPHLRLTLFLPLLRLSTEAHQTKDLPFLAQYLISSFGFSPDRALKVAALPNFSPIKTPDRPESVVRFFKVTGLTDSQIKSLIAWCPQLLCCSVSNTLEPRVRTLVANGFTGQTLIKLIRSSPSVLLLNCALSRLQFWRDYTGNNDALLRTLRRNQWLLQFDIDKVVIPNINLLKDYGFSDADVRRLYIVLGSKLINPDSVKKIIEETEAMGFARKSGMFVLGLFVVGRCTRDFIMRKLEFLKNSYGWSDEEVHTAFKRFPNLVCQSEKTLKCKIDYLLGWAGFTNKDISSKPELLGYSLEKRFVPRQYVLSILNLKGLKRRATLCCVVKSSEKVFLEKFVRPYKNEIPELEEVYAALCQGNVSI